MIFGFTRSLIAGLWIVICLCGFAVLKATRGVTRVFRDEIKEIFGSTEDKGDNAEEAEASEQEGEEGEEGDSEDESSDDSGDSEDSQKGEEEVGEPEDDSEYITLEEDLGYAPL